MMDIRYGFNLGWSHEPLSADSGPLEPLGTSHVRRGNLGRGHELSNVRGSSPSGIPPDHDFELNECARSRQEGS
jgi:hypothetical protein